MWCRVMEKAIQEISENEFENKCINPQLDYCDLCFYCTAIGGTKVTEQEQEKVDKKIRKIKANKELKTIDGIKKCVIRYAVSVSKERNTDETQSKWFKEYMEYLRNQENKIKNEIAN